MSENSMNIDGDRNQALQNVNANNITINIADGLPSEVKQKKESLKIQVQLLSKELAAIKQQVMAETEIPDFEPPDDPAYEKIRWRKLMNSIRWQQCVLFIGPEISIDSDGNSLHRNFYTELAQDFGDIEYLEKEGFFSPGADEAIKYDVMDYYKKDFQIENKIGRSLLQEFAKLPFSLIVSFCPDDTMHRVLSDRGLDHTFLSFDGTMQDVYPASIQEPLIYNVIGNVANDGKYIYTFENFYNYTKNIKLPEEINNLIRDQKNFIFIGFDFEKWHNQYLLFALGLNSQNNNKLCVEGNRSVTQHTEMFLSKQFKMDFVETENSTFVDWLMKNAASVGILKNTEQAVVERGIKEMEVMGIKIADINSLEELLVVEKEIWVAELKIEKFKKSINH